MPIFAWQKALYFPFVSFVIAVRAVQGRACRHSADIVASLANTVLRVLSHIQVLALNPYVIDPHSLLLWLLCVLRYESGCSLLRPAACVSYLL